MTDTLSRSGDVITLDTFHQELLSAMLAEPIPATMTVDQAKALLDRVEKLGAQGMEYYSVLREFLSEVRELTRV
jgi:hypothetical protein